MQPGQLGASARADRALLAALPEPEVSALRGDDPSRKSLSNASPEALGPGSRRHCMPASLPLPLLRVPCLTGLGGRGLTAMLRLTRYVP